MNDSVRRAGLARLFGNVYAWIYAAVLLALVGTICFFEFWDGDFAKFLSQIGLRSAPRYVLPAMAASREEYLAAVTVGLDRMDVLEEREPVVSYPQKVMDYEERVRLADQVLEHALTESDYHDTLVSKMESLVKLAETRNLQSREMLLTAIKAYQAHPDSAVRKLVMLGAADLAFIDFLKTPGGEISPALAAARALLADFPNDEEVARFLDAQSTLLVNRQRYDAAIDLLKTLQIAYHDNANLSIKTMAETLADRIFFVEIRFDQVVERMRNQRPGAQEIFLEALAKIASNPNAGMMSFTEVARAAYFYEQVGRIDNARDIYGLLERKMAFNSDRRIAEAARDSARRGLKRLDSLGRNVDLQGTKPDGTKISLAELRDQIVVLYFWRGIHSQASFQTAVELNETMRLYKDSPVVFLGIAADNDSDEQAMVTFNKIPNWQFKLADHLATVQKLEQDLGIPNGPYVTILDRQGNICAINVTPPQLKGLLDNLLTRVSAQTNRPNPPAGPRAR